MNIYNKTLTISFDSINNIFNISLCTDRDGTYATEIAHNLEELLAYISKITKTKIVWKEE